MTVTPPSLTNTATPMPLPPLAAATLATASKLHRLAITLTPALTPTPTLSAVIAPTRP